MSKHIDHLNPRISLLCGMQRVRLPPRHHEQQLKCMSRLMDRLLSHPSRARLAVLPGNEGKSIGKFSSTGTPAAEKLRAMSFREWCQLIVLPGAFLQTKLWRPRASTVEPQRHSCGEHKSSPSLRLPHHLTASRTRQLGGRTANHCYAVCKQLRKRHGYALLIWITYYYYYYLVPLVV